MQSLKTLGVLLVIASASAVLPAVAQQTYVAQRAALQARGAAALSAEIQRQQSNDCKAAMNTAETSSCFRLQTAATQKSYTEYLASVDGLLRLTPPDSTPPELADNLEIRKNFRLAEARWLRYREAECDAVGLMSCDQDLIRNHLQELASLYARLFQ